MLSSADIRQQFLDFFTARHRHTFVPSSPVVPVADDTLLFANAGMNQFKPYFLGTERPKVTRVVNSQKCIRAGGKHNDLDDVGKDTYHHTFFEMLGNWSFGDYFKEDAIAYAWELLTGVWKLDPRRLHVTVFEGNPASGIPRDDEAAAIWRAVGVAPSHIHLGNAKDNFWEMGNTGPCGPCTEIHYDATPDMTGAALVNQSSDQVVEIWNLVFIQFNRNEDRSLTPLPARHVDTGMGFERITKVLQQKSSNYETDIFTPILAEIAAITGTGYGNTLTNERDIGFRVIADHLRMATMALTDGATPDAKGRGSVVRSVIRRAVRYGYTQFEQREPFLYRLVPTVVAQLGGAFPELLAHQHRVADTLKREERDFFRTVAGGVKRFEAAATKVTGGAFDGKVAADLNQTYGFPVDLTAQLVAERGLTLDPAEVEAAIEDHKKRSRGDKVFNVSALQGELPLTDDSPKYGSDKLATQLLGWVADGRVTTEGTLDEGESVGLILAATPFYAEQGGQVGDAGTVTTPGATFTVETTTRLGEGIVHHGMLSRGQLAAGETVTATRDSELRRDITRNHTATHLMNLALREVLGDHVGQKGSLVDAEKTRFDFTHDAPLTPDETAAIERFVNERLLADLPVAIEEMPLEAAKQLPGVRAVFGEKYPDPVRVVAVGPSRVAESAATDSVEFCCGTHVATTGTIGQFRLVSQEGVAKGVRRVTAVTGAKALDLVTHTQRLLDDASGKLQCSPEQLLTRVAALQAELAAKQAQLAGLQRERLTQVVDELLAESQSRSNTVVLIGELPGADFDLARTQIDRVRQKHPSSLTVLVWAEGEKASIVVGLTKDLVGRGLKAGEIVKQLAPIVGGSGGGKPDFAQAGGKDTTRLPDVLTQARKLAEGLLG